MKEKDSKKKKTKKITNKDRDKKKLESKWKIVLPACHIPLRIPAFSDLRGKSNSFLPLFQQTESLAQQA